MALRSALCSNDEERVKQSDFNLKCWSRLNSKFKVDRGAIIIIILYYSCCCSSSNSSAVIIV